MKQKFISISVAFLSLLLLVAGCRKRDADLADNLVVFETSAQGITASENSITVKLKLVRGTDRDIPVTINLVEEGVVYGTDYTTTPAAAAGKLTVTIPSGNNETSFTLTKNSGVLFDGDEKIVFDLFSSGTPVFIGVARQFTLSFAELVAANSTLTINGGGVLYSNKVFIDLSANRQTAVNRNTWDLGFYTGADDYRVILNSSSAMMAKQINKNDLTQVTAADTVGFSTEVAFNQFAPATISLPYIDYPNGDLARTAIMATSATIDIAKEEAYYFKYISFDNGAVSVEPARKKWDIAWSYFSNVTNFGAGEVPYLFQDIILLNRNVQVAKVMTGTRTFADFGIGDIASQTFLTTQNAIAADWRSGGGPGTSPAVRTDRYYIIKDGDNNYYKLRFTALTQNGERGYPAFEAVWLKRD